MLGYTTGEHIFFTAAFSNQSVAPAARHERQLQISSPKHGLACSAGGDVLPEMDPQKAIVWGELHNRTWRIWGYFSRLAVEKSQDRIPDREVESQIARFHLESDNHVTVIITIYRE